MEDKRSFNKEKNLGKGRALWIALDIQVSHMAEGQVQRLHLLHVPCLTALTPASHPNPSLYRASQIPNNSWVTADTVLLRHGGNIISNYAGAQGASLALLLSLSHMEPSTMLFFPTLRAQQSLFLTSYLCIHLGKNFLDFIPKLRPCHSQTWCCVRQNDQTIPNLSQLPDR